MNNNTNFLLAAMLSLVVMIGWQAIVVEPKIQQQRQAQQQSQQAEATAETAEIGVPQTAPNVLDAPSPQTRPQPAPQLQNAPISTSPRIAINTPQLEGSIALRGAQLDDLVLTQYKQTRESDVAVRLLTRQAGGEEWRVSYGWVNAPQGRVKTPNDNTLWQRIGTHALTPETPITLRYDNGEGQVFTRRIAVDDAFMFTITQSVKNNAPNAITLYPYGQIARRGAPEGPEIFILHQGGIGVLGDDGLVEIDYDDMAEDSATKIASRGGWLGLSDKYWATALIPPQDAQITGRFSGAVGHPYASFRADFLMGGQQIAKGQTIRIESRAFVGAKVVNLIDAYAAQGIDNFDLMIDWGWFYFLTKPMFFALEFFYGLLGNYGLSILFVTVIIKLLFFPLASRSYETMAKMKKLQPKMTELRETYKDDRMRQQQELLKIYREENLRPLAGCLPILLQIPVFFALYKILFVTLDMRHQPFFGWIQDLSAPDPTSLFNLFGLLPFDPPSFLLIGVWPLLMGITMFVQMQMNPPPPDPIQARIFMALPILFTFILASFPAGLVIYWAWNNFLSILQQGFIMRRFDVPIELMNNLRFGKNPPE